MLIIRRVYLYLLALAGLAMLAAGIANLLQLVVALIDGSQWAADPASLRENLALSASAALIGLPVWWFHWRFAQRLSIRSQLERASTLRRLYAYVVLAVSMAMLAGSARDALTAALTLALGGHAVRAGNALEPLPFTLVAAVVWFSHWRVSLADRAAVGEQGGSATLRRWYVYGVAFIGWLILLYGCWQSLQNAWELFVAPASFAAPDTDMAAPVASAVVGLALWLGHWRGLASVTFSDDRTATLRSVYLFLGLGEVVCATLLWASQLAYYALSRALDIAQPEGELLQIMAAPISGLIVFGLAWLYQSVAVRGQAATTPEAPRQAGIRRLYMYLISLLALGVLATGAGGLLWLLSDAVTGGPGWNANDGWRSMVVLYATMLVVGLPTWLAHWRPAALADAASLARRLYAYLALIVGMLAALGSLAVVLYRLFTLLLGEPLSGGLTTDLTHAAALALVAVAVAGYHALVVRRDASATRSSLIESQA